MSKESMAFKASESDVSAESWERVAGRDAKIDPKLGEKTKAVVAAIRARAAYIRNRLDG